MLNHSKQKGNVGVSSVIKELHKLEYNVFVELGDYSKIDLIAEKNGKLIRIQVKYCKFARNDAVELNLRKSGPNGYRYTYVTEDFDYFAVYLPTLDKVIFIPAAIALANKTVFTIRLDAPKNNQKNSHFIKDFEKL